MSFFEIGPNDSLYYEYEPPSGNQSLTFVFIPYQNLMIDLLYVINIITIYTVTFLINYYLLVKKYLYIPKLLLE